MLVQQALAGGISAFTSTIQYKCIANIHFYKVESLQAKNMPEMVVIWSIALYNYSSIAQRYFQSDNSCDTTAEFGEERRNKHEA